MCCSDSANLQILGSTHLMVSTCKYNGSPQKCKWIMRRLLLCTELMSCIEIFFLFAERRLGVFINRFTPSVWCNYFPRILLHKFPADRIYWPLNLDKETYVSVSMYIHKHIWGEEKRQSRIKGPRISYCFSSFKEGI